MQINRKSFGTLKSDRYGRVTVMDEWPPVLARFSPPGRNRAAEILSARAAEIPFCPSFSPMGRNY